MSGSMFNLYLHQNYIDFFSDIDDVVRASDYLSIADVLCSNWNVSVIFLYTQTFLMLLLSSFSS